MVRTDRTAGTRCGGTAWGGGAAKTSGTTLDPGRVRATDVTPASGTDALGAGTFGTGALGTGMTGDFAAGAAVRAAGAGAYC